MSAEEAVALMAQEEIESTTVPIVSQVTEPGQTAEVEEEDLNPLAGLKGIDASFTTQMATQKATPYGKFLDVLNSLEQSKRKANFVTEEEFNSYSPEKQETVLQQLKNC